jgi:hypothetical protein
MKPEGKAVSLWFGLLHFPFAMAGSRTPPCGWKPTFKRRETTTQKQFKIAKLPLGENNSGQRLGLCCKLVMSWEISCNEVSEELSIFLLVLGSINLINVY